MNRIAGRAITVVVVAVLLLAGVFYFLTDYAMHAEEWVTFPGSPHLYNGGNIGCGIITDRDGAILLSMGDARSYSDSEPLRMATVHWIGDRAGSVSAPALAHYSAQMAGYSKTTGTYQYGNAAGNAKLTLSARAQIAALEALGNRKGTAAVYNYKTGEILCAVSTPSFDPDFVPDIQSDPEKYDGIYLNRFTQGTYTPGSIFKIVTLAAVLEEKPELLDHTFTCTGSLDFGKDSITCEAPHWEQSIKQAFRNSCNCVFGQLAQELGADTLMKYVEKFGIMKPVSFDGITTSGGNFDVHDTAPVSLGWAAIGQYTDLINPCAFLTFVGAIANDGQTTVPHIVEQIHVGKKNTFQSKTYPGERIMSSETAAVLQEYMRFNVQDKYGDEHFPGLTVCAKTGTAEVGKDRAPTAMLAGFVQDENYPLAFIVCVEEGGYGSKTCIPIASKLLSLLKDMM